ncbi:MAG: hypothetical protein IJ849_09435 [Selenomonadaceae bacterium]|nr:hypothetical protein [Selenomonadaceae bacterium]
MGAGRGRTGAAGGGGKGGGGSGGGAPPAFPATDSSPFHTLADEDGYEAKQNFSAATQTAVQTYLDPNPTRGSLYAPSQQLNHALRQGQPLTASQQQTYNGLMAGMHNLGENLSMTRYDRVGFMQTLGINNYDRMKITTLKKRLVGHVYTDAAFVSVSANNFSKSPTRNPFTDKAIKINIKAPASAQGLKPGTGPGGNFGEFLLAPNQNYRITDVRWTGKQGRSGAQYYKQIELDVEMF